MLFSLLGEPLLLLLSELLLLDELGDGLLLGLLDGVADGCFGW